MVASLNPSTWLLTTRVTKSSEQPPRWIDDVSDQIGCGRLSREQGEDEGGIRARRSEE